MLARPERHHPANVRYNMAKKKTKGYNESNESAAHEMKEKKMKVKKPKKGK